MRILLLSILLFIISITNAQEIKKVTKEHMNYDEVYHVLVNNNQIKHGTYLKYFESMNPIDKIAIEYGNYVNNKKDGPWLYFDTRDLTNPLIFIGSYRDDIKDGEWIYFYNPKLTVDSTFRVEEIGLLLCGSARLTHAIIADKRSDPEVKIDTSYLRIAATGNYINGEKTGMWKYYFRDGTLAGQYDFSSTENTEFLSDTIPFDSLGSIERFKRYFIHSISEKRLKTDPIFSQNTKAEYEIYTFRDSFIVKLKDFVGSKRFATFMQQALQNMSNEWMNYDPRLEKNRIYVRLDFVISESGGILIFHTIKPEVSTFR